MKNLLRFFLKRGSIIGESRDTGYRIYEAFAHKLKNDCAQPVFTHKLPETKPVYVRSFLNVLVEKFLPDRFCYLPKKFGYYSKKSFSDLGYKGVLDQGWDEFIWQDKPFAFHMQGAQKDGTTKDHSNDLSYLKKVLDYYSRLNK